MMTRDEHLNWAKRRALEYLDAGDVKMGVASMLSDLRKHPETAQIHPSVELLGLRTAIDDDVPSARRFIEGFR